MARVLPFCFLIELMRKIQFHIMKKKKDFNFCRSIFMLFKICGLAPFTVVISKQKKSTPMRFCYSRIGSVYNITLLSTLLLCNCAIIYSKMHLATRDWQSLNGAVRIINTSNGTISLSIILIMYYLKQNEMVTISNRLTKLTNTLETQLHSLCLLPRRKYILMSIIFMHILNYSIRTIFWTVIFPLDLLDSINMIGLTVTSFSLGLFMVQYAFLLNFLENAYASLNTSLEILMKSNEKSFQNTISPMAPVSYVDELRGKLFFINNARRVLCEVSNQISDTFGLPALITVTFCCIKLIFDSYFVMSTVLSSITASKIFICFVVIMKDVFPIIVLTVYGTRISEQTKRSSAIVHEMMAECPADMSLIKYQLQQFSMELLHQGEISFEACGFIPIDGSLLNSMISTTITYMVIVLQYVQTK